MAAIHELLAQVADEELRKRLEVEIDKLSKNKKFGLVFEEHIPECTALYDVAIKRGMTVARKNGPISEQYSVLSLRNGTASCVRKVAEGVSAPKAVVPDVEKFPVDELVAVAQFGEPIYPYLKPLGSVCNAPDSDLWHTLIEADNYHALQLLEYLYAGKVDCIYIDPPYNTGAKDWKYNNDYVDGNDVYRHSKWLSMMKKRLLLAKRLLNPKDSVLIVTIDEKEYLHLGCLLEEMFPEAHTQMVSIVINPNGVARDHEMYRLEEYAFFVYMGEAGPVMLEDSLFTSDVQQRKIQNGKDSLGEVDDSTNHSQRTDVRWERLMRGGSNSDRPDRENLFYPVYIDPVAKRIVEVGEALPLDQDRTTVPHKEGLVTVWPIAEGSGKEKTWRNSPQKLKELIKQGYAKVGAYNKQKDRWSLLYLGKKQRERIADGQIKIIGRDSNGVVVLDLQEELKIKRVPKTIWNRQTHSAGEYGSRMTRAILSGRIFPFPKSLYAVADTLRTIVSEKPNALIIDFFAGSGTTLHAVNLLNAEDGGQRRCIMVTNNEVSETEAKTLTKQGYHPGDEEWEKLGIARYVTWPRTVCSIEGHDVNGDPLKGSYIGSDIPMSDGFAANAAYFKLGFLDKNMVSLGRQFKELLPILWLKTGAHGVCPALEAKNLPDMLILPENHFAVLLQERSFENFRAKVNELPQITTIFFVTDYETSYRAMSQSVKAETTYQLYRDYLDNFRINFGRD